MRFHLTVTRVAIIKNTKRTSVDKDVEKLEPKYITVRNGKWHSHCGKQYVSSSKYEIRDYDYIQKFHFWVFIPKRMESRNSDTCMPMFIAALFLN